MTAEQLCDDPEYAAYTWVVPGDYIYTGEWPRGCAGQRYRVHRRVLYVPVNQVHVLVEALTGSDAGLWFTCALDNFAHRYKPDLEATL